METLKKNSKYIGLVGCALMLLGNFFPFFTVTVSFLGYSQSESITFVDGDGVFVLIAAIVAGILILLKKDKLSLVPTIIAAAITLYDVSNAESIIGNTLGFGKISYGFGFWTIILGIILAIICVVLNWSKTKNMSAIKMNDSVRVNEYKFCANCGAQINKISKFCSKCGKEV